MKELVGLIPKTDDEGVVLGVVVPLVVPVVGVVVGVVPGVVLGVVLGVVVVEFVVEVLHKILEQQNPLCKMSERYTDSLNMEFQIVKAMAKGEKI